MHLVVWVTLMGRLIKIISTAVLHQRLECMNQSSFPCWFSEKHQQGGGQCRVAGHVACSRASLLPELQREEQGDFYSLYISSSPSLL